MLVFVGIITHMKSMITPSRSPLGKVWYGIKDRCTNPKCESYKRYGACGITCQFESLIHFREWALKNGWQKGMQIHRKDPLGPYSPDNCQVLTREDHIIAHLGPDYRLRSRVRARWQNCQKYGRCVEWEDFEIFYQWATSNGWHSGQHIRRHDIKLPHSPTNSYITDPPVHKPYVKKGWPKKYKPRKNWVYKPKKAYVKKGWPKKYNTKMTTKKVNLWFERGDISESSRDILLAELIPEREQIAKIPGPAGLITSMPGS